MLKKVIISMSLALAGASWAQSSKRGAELAVDEMAVYREIMERKIATRQDLYHLLAMQSGDFDKYTKEQALNAALKKKGIDIKENPAAEVTRGEVSKAILQAYDLEKGLFYTLTGWEFYALRDIQQAGIMESKFAPGMKLSGRQLIAIINLAAEKAEEKSNYQVKK